MHDWKKGYIKVVAQKGDSNSNRYGIQYLSGGIISKIESGELETYRVSTDPAVPTIDVKNYRTAAATIPTLWTDKRFYTAQGKSQIKDLFGKSVFSYPKPVDLIYNIIKRVLDQDSIVLDFFSGSAATAHAVMKLNAEDGGNRKYIMVQLAEECEEGTEAAKAGYLTVCEIGEDRIRRAGKQILDEYEKKGRQASFDDDDLQAIPDVGFRVLRIDSSNFRNTYTDPSSLIQASLYDFIDNLKDDRLPEDLLFQVLPSFRIPYSASIDEFEIDGVKCFNVNEGQLIACFDAEVDTDVIEKIAQERPIYAVFRDSSLADDSTAANFEELFKTYSPDTIRRVI